MSIMEYRLMTLFKLISTYLYNWIGIHEIDLEVHVQRSYEVIEIGVDNGIDR